MLISDLITGSLRLVGRLKPGRVANNSELVAALVALNEMIDSWATERLMTYEIVRQTFTLTPGTGVYQIGVGVASPNFNTARPVRIEEANAVSGGATIPIKLVNAQEYSEVTEKLIEGVIPRKIYFDGAWPNANIYLWPVPSAATTLEIYTWQALLSSSGGPGFVNLGDNLSVPPGYQKALRFNLAVAFAAEYGLDVRPDVLRNAADAKQKILQLNSALELEAQQQAQLEQMNLHPRQDEVQGQPTGIAA
jgi:hypothetical protein